MRDALRGLISRLEARGVEGRALPQVAIDANPADNNNNIVEPEDGPVEEVLNDAPQEGQAAQDSNNPDSVPDSNTAAGSRDEVDDGQD